LTPLPAQNLDLVDEDQGVGLPLAQGRLPRCLEELAHPLGAHAGIHFDKLGTARRYEGGIRIAGRSPGHQGFPRSRRPGEEDAFQRADAEPPDILVVFNKIQGLAELLNGRVLAADVVKGDLLAGGASAALEIFRADQPPHPGDVVEAPPGRQEKQEHADIVPQQSHGNQKGQAQPDTNFLAHWSHLPL